MSPPVWAYQVDAFDPSPDEELVCSICHSVFCDPVQSPCNHVFCRNCIHKWLEMNRNCPICRKRTIRYSIQEVVPLIRNMIMKLTLRCHNSERGCEAKFTLEACEAHVKECIYEMIQCKNKPCKQMILRKDMNDHERHDCSHRYVQCKKCGLKISLVVPQKHDCIRALKQCLKEKVEVIKKKKQKIKDLQSEIKILKEKEQQHSETSSIDSIGEAAIMMNLNDMSSLSSGSSVSSTSFVSNSEIDEAVASFTSDVLEGLERRFHNSAEEFQVEDDSIEYPRYSSPFPVEYESRLLGDSIASAALDLSTEDEAPIRRPAKRRLPSALLDSSDEDQDGFEMPPLPSPKRVWRLNRLDGGDSALAPVSSDESSGLGTSTQEAAGPSSEPTTSAAYSTGLDTITTLAQNARSTKQMPRFGRRGRRLAAENTTTTAASGLRYNGGTFERTIAMLSQYNLESDPEWVPGNSNPVDEEDDIEDRPRDGYITSSDESSLSDSDSDSSFESSRAKKDLLAKMFSSSSDDDPDFLPI